MQVTETLNEGLKRQFTVVVPAATIAEQTDARLKEVAKTLKMPGFRPGKVPFSLVKQRYGASATGEVLEQLVQSSSQQALTDRGLRAAEMPKIENVKFEEGSDLEFSMTLDVLPEIEPIDFTTLKLERLKAEASNEEIDKGLQRLSKGFGGSKPLEETRPAVLGDVTVIDFVGKIDGVAFDGGTGEDYNLELGSGSFIPGFEDQVVGQSVGEVRDITVTFPADYQAEHLAGKDAVFTVTVKEIRVPEAVAIDDDLAKKFGMEGLEALRNAVRERIEQDYVGAARFKLKRALLDELAKAHDFPIPQGMADREFNGIWSQIEDAKKEGKLDEEQAAKSEDELKAEYRVIADRRVRLGLLLAEVGRRADVRVTEDEIRGAMIAEARRYPGQERQVIEFFRNTPEAVDRLRAPIYEEKVVDHILEIASVTDKIVTPEELFREAEEAAA